MDEYENSDDFDESYQIKVANACTDIRGAVGLSDITNNAQGYSVSYVSTANLSHEQREEIFSIAQENMKKMYDDSGWGWRPVEKRNEFFHSLSRFVVITHGNKIVAYSIFRFDYDDEDEPEFIVLYIYEMQVREEYRRQGLGAEMMASLGKIAKHFNMRKILLTCFKMNIGAMDFYSKQGFKIDKISPSNYGANECYEVLSRRPLL